jgi:flavin reductase (DIM6/NTAB) family NADH-FMN oxidoreductase RutF
MLLDPQDLSIPDRYKLLIGGITPRPIALVSTISTTGRYNLAPFSFFAGVGSNPMTLLFCPANTDLGQEKDTLRNCKSIAQGGMGEFVVNIVSHAIAHQMAAAAEPLPHGESEFTLTGLTPVPSTKVKPPRVQQSPLSYECRTLDVIRTNPGQPAGGNIVLGEILAIHVRDDAINDRFHLDPALVDTIGRMGGQTYCTTRDRFDMPSGRKAFSVSGNGA